MDFHEISVIGIFYIIQRAPIKKLYLEKILFRISAKVAQIRTKLSEFVCEYSYNILQILLELTLFNRYSSLNFNFSSEPAVVHWRFTNNKLNFAHLFINQSNVSVINVSCLYMGLIQYSKQCSKCSAAEATHDRSLLQYQWTLLQIIPYHQQNSLLFGNVGQLCYYLW